MKPAPLAKIVVLNLFLLAACTVVPKVKYVQGSTGNEGTIMFRLIDGRIVISQASQASDEKPQLPVLTTKNDAPISDITVTVVPKESTAHLYGIVPQSQYLGTVDTYLSSTFYDNSRVLHKLGVEVVDNRIKTVEAIGAIAGIAAKAALLDKGKTREEPLMAVPVVLHPSEEKDEKWHPLPGNEGWAYRIKMKANDDMDAEDADCFFKKHALTGWFNATSVFPVSSCKEATLELSPVEELANLAKKEYSKKDQANLEKKRSKADIQQIIDSSTKSLETHALKRTFGFKIPDPKKVRLIGIPPKGEITTHTLCGANTTSQPSSAASAYDILSTLMKQAESVYE